MCGFCIFANFQIIVILSKFLWTFCTQELLISDRERCVSVMASVAYFFHFSPHQTSLKKFYIKIVVLFLQKIRYRYFQNHPRTQDVLKPRCMFNKVYCTEMERWILLGTRRWQEYKLYEKVLKIKFVAH